MDRGGQGAATETGLKTLWLVKSLYLREEHEAIGHLLGVVFLTRSKRIIRIFLERNRGIDNDGAVF